MHADIQSMSIVYCMGAWRAQADLISRINFLVIQHALESASDFMPAFGIWGVDPLGLDPLPLKSQKIPQKS